MLWWLNHARFYERVRVINIPVSGERLITNVNGRIRGDDDEGRARLRHRSRLCIIIQPSRITLLLTDSIWPGIVLELIPGSQEITSDTDKLASLVAH